MDHDWLRWRSCHLYYHSDLDLLLGSLVHPLVGSLLRSGAVDRFFFTRYQLGGPHVRLRLRVAAGMEDDVGSAVERGAAEFFARRPSTRTLPTAVVLRRNREILAADPGESDDGVYPDNSLRILPFVPEVDRYGGPERVGISLDFFTLSSIRALRLASETGSRSHRIPGMLRLLAGQALGFARDAGEWRDLLGYAAVIDGHPLSPFTARGDWTFEEQPEAFQRLVEEVVAGGDARTPAGEARRLATALKGVAPDVRRRILRSQMHMTANRLGLRNPEEVWLGRVLSRAAQETGAALPAPGRTLDGEAGLEDLLPTAFAAMMQDPEAPSVARADAFC